MFQWLLRKLGVRKNVIHGRNLHVGIGSRLWAPTRLSIGNDVYIGRFCSVEVNGSIGDGTMLANNVGLVGRTDHDILEVGHQMSSSGWVGNRTDLETAIHIGPDCWIGFGVVVLGGVSIGASCIVGAGSVVSRSLPPNSIAVGNPAKPIRNRFTATDLSTHWQELGIVNHGE